MKKLFSVVLALVLVVASPVAVAPALPVSEACVFELIGAMLRRRGCRHVNDDKADSACSRTPPAPVPAASSHVTRGSRLNHDFWRRT